MNHASNINASKVDQAWWLLRLVYGLVPIVGGLDKFGLNYIVDWEGYISPVILQYLPLSALHFVYLVGVIEIIAGLLVLSSYTRLGAYLVAFWLFLISINLVTMGYGYYDLAIRDVVIAAGALALALLTEAKKNK